jgi:Mg-chelatase subunit ChlD
MRRFLSSFVAVALLFGLGLALSPLMPAAAAPNAAAPRQRGEESTCVPEANKVAYPNVLLLGEETHITLTVKALCAAEAYPLHISLVMDSSGSMAGEKNASLKRAVKQLIRDLKLNDYPQIQVAVIKFSGAATTLCKLTNDEGRLISCANRIDANGGTAIDAGIRTGMRELVAGRPRGSGAGAIREVMVVLSDGQNNAGCQPVMQAAGQAKSQGILMMTVCVGSDCDASCMRQAASSARYFFQIDNAGGLAAAFAKIRDEVLNINLKKMTITDVLPANMQYVEDSAQPAPDKGDPTAGFTWQANYVPRDGLTITFKVRPLETGYHPTNVQAVGELLDNQNRSKDFEFPVPHVTVLQPFPLATVTNPPPTPTYTPTPTPTNTPPFTPTPTNTPTPTPTPTRVPGPIYLPILLREDCKRQYVYADIVLVTDVSTSMDRPTSTGRSKIQAAIARAQEFVALVDLASNENGQHSQIGVVGFNAAAWTQISLTNDRAAIVQALSDLPKRRNQYTRLDLAFAQAQATLFGPGRIDANTPVIILLTDGLPNRVPLGPDGSQNSTVLAAAQRAKDADARVRVYTIGIGAPTDVDAQLLAECATSPDDYFYEADPEDLDHVYNEIAFSFGCLGGKHDWSQPWE